MSQVAIRVENLGKQFRIGGRVERYQTLRESLVRKLKGLGRRESSENTFWALRGVSFTVDHGDVVGVIGNNGAGKSTLLKVLSQISEPTEGYADVHGRVSSLLEIGSGFHFELSGRENIYLNGAILGMRRAEIDRKFDEIVAFAGVEKFIDTAVKHYSSGMYLRLAFSVAASLEPEILMVDEVLAVGDIAFQNKCLRKMGQVAGEGRTVILVSHNLSAISSLTKRCILLKHGRVHAAGPTSEIVAMYLRDSATEGSAVAGSREIKDDTLGSLLCELDSEGVNPTIPSTQPIKVRFWFTVKQAVTGLRVGFDLTSGAGPHLFRTYYDDLAENPPELQPGAYAAECTIPPNWLNGGDYYITLRASIHGIRHIIVLERALGFQIVNLAGANAQYGVERPGLLNPTLDWKIEPTDPATLPTISTGSDA